ncbi:MAG: hypothetical protein JOZ81_28205 [Chloroflexi bacterium]|nr:hypothetical protein [Chloroflexota bacterium]
MDSEGARLLGLLATSTRRVKQLTRSLRSRPHVAHVDGRLDIEDGPYGPEVVVSVDVGFDDGKIVSWVLTGGYDGRNWRTEGSIRFDRTGLGQESVKSLSAREVEAFEDFLPAFEEAFDSLLRSAEELELADALSYDPKPVVRRREC